LLINDVFLNIYLRRAVREYKPDDVPDDIIKELIKAGTYAPSALNEQPWRFVVIKNRALMDKYSNRAKELWLKSNTGGDTAELIKLASDPAFDIFYGAPVLVLIFAVPGADSPELDCALAAENMMLAATSIDLGSCWIGLSAILGSDKEFLGEMGVAEDYRLMAQLILGYPAKKKLQAPERNKDVIMNWIK
jgi:nitroreductase